MEQNRNFFKKLATIAATALVGQYFAPLVLVAHAANFDQAFLRLTNQETGTTGGRVCAEPATTATEASVQVVFPTGWTVNATAANWTVTTTGLDSGQTAWPGIGTATSVSGQTVTFPSTDLTVGTTLYCFNFAETNTLTTTSGANQTGTILTRDSVPATIDSTDYATDIISDDDIPVTATVPPTFDMTLDTTTIALGNLAPGSIISGSGRNLTIATNAAHGWIAWVRNADRNPSPDGLRSATAAYTIASLGSATDGTPTTLVVSDSNEEYQLDVDITTDGGGSGTAFAGDDADGSGIEQEYNGSGVNQGGSFSDAFQPIARTDGTTDGDVVSLVVRANIKGSTPAAADYTDTLTVIAAGNF